MCEVADGTNERDDEATFDGCSVGFAREKYFMCFSAYEYGVLHLPDGVVLEIGGCTGLPPLRAVAARPVWMWTSRALEL